MIQIPINVGDVILTGRFKNKKVVVKEIGRDDHGMPTINGRGIMKIRLLNKKEKDMTESKVKTKKIREQSEEGTVNIGKTIPVKIKKEGDRFCIYRVMQPSGDEVKALNRDFGSKEEAERTSKLRGFTLVSDKNEIQEYEIDKQPRKLKTAKDKVEYVTEIIRRVLRESKGQKKKISEAEVTDPALEAKFDEIAELEQKYTKMKAMVDAFMKEIGYEDIENKYKSLVKDDPAVWAYFMEIKKTGDKIIRTKKSVIEVKRHATETETFSHKDAYLTALTKVNAATRKVLEDELNATKSISKRIGAYSAQSNESKVIGESWFGKIKDWFKKFANTLVNKFKTGNNQVEQSLQQLEQISAKIR